MEESVRKRMQWVLRGLSPAEEADRHELEALTATLDERVDAQHQEHLRVTDDLRQKSADCARLMAECTRLKAELAGAHDIIAEYRSMKKSLLTAVCYVQAMLQEARGEASERASSTPALS